MGVREKDFTLTGRPPQGPSPLCSQEVDSTMSLEKGHKSADMWGSPNKAVHFAHWSKAPSPKAIFEEHFGAAPWLWTDCQGPRARE